MIVTITVNPALDVNTKAEHIAPGKKIRCEKPSREPGGGGVNVSRALHILGATSTAIYTTGGHVGAEYHDLLVSEGINGVGIELDEPTRENFIVRETGGKGDIYRFGTPGATLEDKDWKALNQKIGEFTAMEYLVASGSLPPGAPENYYAQLGDIARRNKARLIVDSSGKPLKHVLHSGAYLLKPNKEELAALAGVENLNNEEDQKKIVKDLLKQHPIEVIVLSLGEAGAVLATKNEYHRFDALSVEKKSTVGAGDSMVAGIVYSLSKGKTLVAAVLHGLACGSAAIMTPGTELLRKEDANRLYKKLTS